MIEHREMTKLIFTLGLLIGAGYLERPLGVFLFHYLNHIARGIPSSQFFTYFSIFPFLFYFHTPNSSLFLLLHENGLILFSVTGVTGVTGVKGIYHLILHFSLNFWMYPKFVPGQARPSQETSQSSSVLPLTTCCLLIYWGCFCNTNSWSGGGEGKLLKTKNLVSKSYSNNVGVGLICKLRSEWCTAINESAFAVL